MNSKVTIKDHRTTPPRQPPVGLRALPVGTWVVLWPDGNRTILCKVVFLRGDKVLVAAEDGGVLAIRGWNQPFEVVDVTISYTRAADRTVVA